MKVKNYASIISFVSLTILATISLQVYWNLKNYKENKQRLINDVQIAFDNSTEYYYIEQSKENYIAFVNRDNSISEEQFMDDLKLDTVFKDYKAKRNQNKIPKVDSIKSKKKSSVTVSLKTSESKIRLVPDTSNLIKLNSKISKNEKEYDTKIVSYTKPKSKTNSSVLILRGKKATDSLLQIKDSRSRIVISMLKDSVAFNKLSKILDNELSRKKIVVDYTLEHFKLNTLFDKFKKNTSVKLVKLPLSTFSKSVYLPINEKLKISFSDPTVLLLKRSMIEIILSLLLSLSIVGSLFYLLRIINRQKKIDEIKSDLISNITHEFKTPITTISSAIEGIKNFNSVNDPKKTNRYLEIASQQLEKLAIMVEKLLETASLESDNLTLNKEPINVVQLLKKNVEKHLLNTSSKTIDFISNQEELILNVDTFHFENAISNLIDNALKYGGPQIEVCFTSDKKKIEITVQDNGIEIDKNQHEKIFEKFYRIPKGNIHDVKGFGIGLYYSKKIIEKHRGTLELIVNVKNIFKITLPNV